MAKLCLRVLKLCKLLCFKTSLLLGTTTIRGGSEFCRPWQNYALRVLKALESGCAFKTSLLRGTTGVRARSELDNGE
ncbi:hypothetical protein [Treponema phagedenis]|uniref:hypothetical protein n=1 Tax=Treponema phagedenis TaxID=162 RepID=UPI001980E408|nr:hypothetical protein [Treponema phagedenis]